MDNTSVLDKIDRIKFLLGVDSGIDSFLKKIVERHIVKALPAEKKRYIYRTGTNFKRFSEYLYLERPTISGVYYAEVPVIHINCYLYDPTIPKTKYDLTKGSLISFSIGTPIRSIGAPIRSNEVVDIPLIVRDLKNNLERHIKNILRDNDYSINEGIWEHYSSHIGIHYGQ